MPLAQPEHEPHHHAASSALLLWSIAMVVGVTPSVGFVLVGLRGVTLLAAATVATGVGFGILYPKYSEVYLNWLQGRIEVQAKLSDLERRAKLLGTAIDRAKSLEKSGSEEGN